MPVLSRIAAATALLLLAACAGTPKTETFPTDWQAQRKHIEAIAYFTASGKIALRTAEQAESASLLWQQLGESSHLRLSGPMGLSATTVDSNGREVIVRQGSETRRWDIDEPMPPGTPALDLPLAALQHWLKGVPAPGMELELLQLDPAGVLPQALKQQGWRVEYQAFASFEGYTLPTRLKVSRQDTSARIILRLWEGITAR
jgi:outer membrane lipoprotein LolB